MYKGPAVNKSLFIQFKQKLKLCKTTVQIFQILDFPKIPIFKGQDLTKRLC